jgi:phosphoribosyl-dephospho-CoA transferase
VKPAALSLDAVRPPATGDDLALQRHALVWLAEAAWPEILAANARDAQAQACLAHWAEQDLPLVVTRQPTGPLEAWQLGVSAPLRWSRRKLLVSASAGAIRRVGAFPAAREIEGQFDGSVRADFGALCGDLAALDIDARVYGSRGWQWLSGLAHAVPGSDIDLLLQARSPEHADRATALLDAAALDGARLDGELMFPNGAAVAWREWSAWRNAGTADRPGPERILVKRLQSTSLEKRLEAFA